MDLDRFKEVNDVFGHVVGDELLRRVSQRFREVADGAQIARVGGDEFTCIVSGKALPARASDLAGRLHDAVAAPFDIDGRQIRISVSIGVALYPDHGDIEAVLANADAALYRAKAEGGGGICFFDSCLDTRLRERRALVKDLETAIERNELLLHYQPQVDANDDIFGFEALLRWRHPRRGLVAPGEFVPVAEESGLIVSDRRMGVARSLPGSRRHGRCPRRSGSIFRPSNSSRRGCLSSSTRFSWKRAWRRIGSNSRSPRAF